MTRSVHATAVTMIGILIRTNIDVQDITCSGAQHSTVQHSTVWMEYKYMLCHV